MSIADTASRTRVAMEYNAKALMHLFNVAGTAVTRNSAAVSVMKNQGMESWTSGGFDRILSPSDDSNRVDASSTSATTAAAGCSPSSKSGMEEKPVAVVVSVLEDLFEERCRREWS
jgi:hypothetical protein